VSDADQARELPLWKSWVKEIGESLKWGDAVTSAELVKYLDEHEDSLQFAMAIHQIRKWFRRRGMNFTSRGQSGAGYVISQPNTNRAEMERMARAAASAMREGVILGSATPLEMLTEEERRIHDKLTENMAIRMAMLSRKTKPSEDEIERAQKLIKKKGGR
jgi:hypothetical protein